MGIDRIILRNTDSPYTGGTDFNKGSVLTFSELDQNFINLKGLSIKDFNFSGNTLEIRKYNGDNFNIDFSGIQQNAVLYTNSNPTYQTIGGIEINSTFDHVTMQDMWTDLLYPNLNPKFTMFKIDGQSTSLDVGDIVPSGDTTWLWDTINDNFIQSDTIKIYDYTNNILIGEDISNTGNITLPQPVEVKLTEKGSHVWKIMARKYNNTYFSRFLYIFWWWRLYWGKSDDPNLDENGIKNLDNNILSRLITHDLDFTGSGYLYIAIPKSYGWIKPYNNPHHYWSWKQPDFIRDKSTNLNLALSGPSEGYDQVVNGLYYKDMMITNDNGYSPNTGPIEKQGYYIFRSKYKLNGNITIQIQ